MPINPFGEFIRERRLTKRMTIRAFSAAIQMDPSNYCRIEQGAEKPPVNSNKLHAIARALEIPIDSDDYKEMERLADIGRGDIPRALMSDEELLGKLPVFFRTIDQKRIDGEKLDRLIETIRQEF